jgi:preprotein translocase subunit SecF
MELFKNTNYDFLSKKWLFIGLSLALTAAGLISIAVKGGLKYGIDFRGGVLMQVQFASNPPLDRIRNAMSQKIKGEVSVQNFTGVNAKNQVEIGTEKLEEGQLNRNRQAMEDVLRATFGASGSSKPDFNSLDNDQIANQLREGFARNSVPMNDQQLSGLVKSLKSYANSEYSGLITDFSQLSGAPGADAGVINTLKQEFSLAPYIVKSTEMVGPKVGADLQKKAVLATLYALAGMLVYIGFRFEWIYGLGAVIAVFHDTIITLGLFSLFNKDISMTVIAALLTLVGYSMNDTIVIFDRIRENLRISRRDSLEGLMNRSINQTLSRTVMTSGLTFLTAIALLIWGGPVLNGFSFALVCGIIVGTYSSVFIASPIVLFWRNYIDSRSKPNGAAPAAATLRPDGARKAPTKAAR